LGILVAASVVTLSCTLLIVNKGWPSRMPEGAQELMKIKPRQDMLLRKKFLQENCIPKGDVFCGKRKPGETNILLLGDSRVLDIYLALKTAYPEANIRASYAMGCAPVFSPDIGQSMFFPDCPQFNQARLQEALDAPDEDMVFLAQSLSGWREEAVLETVERLRKARLKFLSICSGLIPRGGNWKNISTKSPSSLMVNLPTRSIDWVRSMSATGISFSMANIISPIAKRASY
jgi:hypothetical protein